MAWKSALGLGPGSASGYIYNFELMPNLFESQFPYLGEDFDNNSYWNLLRWLCPMYMAMFAYFCWCHHHSPSCCKFNVLHSPLSFAPELTHWSGAGFFLHDLLHTLYSHFPRLQILLLKFFSSFVSSVLHRFLESKEKGKGSKAVTMMPGASKHLIKGKTHESDLISSLYIN